MYDHPHAPAPRASFRPKPDGSKDPAGEIGWYLQRERELRGISLERAGQETGIHPNHIDAIEAGALDRLPDRATTLDMIGKYAAYLGYDPQPLVRRYAALLPKAEKNGLLSSARIIAFPLLKRLSDVSSGAGGIVASVLAVVLVFGGLVWAFLPGSDDPGEGWTEITAEAETPGKTASADQGMPANHAADPRIVGSISALAEKVAGEDAPAAAASAEGQNTAPSQPDAIAALIARTVPDLATETEGHGATEQASQKAEPAAASNSGKAVKAQKETKVSTAAPAAAPAHSITLRSRAEIWVQLEDKRGRSLYRGTMVPGATYTLPRTVDPDTLLLTTGNGAALELIADGKALGPLKPEGGPIVAAEFGKLIKERLKN